MSDATAVIKALRQATASEKQQILEALGQGTGSRAHTAATVAANVESLRAGFEVLSEEQAVALLADSSFSVWATSEGELLGLLEPWMDAHWEALEGELGRLCLLCGRFGESVLRKVEQRVRRARRGRGAAEIAQLSSLMELARGQALEAAMEKGLELDEAALDEAVSGVYQELLAAYARELGNEPGAIVFGGFSAGDIALLRECKKWIERNEPSVYRGGWKELNERLAALFTRARRSGMAPGVAEREMQIRAERRRQPNVLFKGLRKGEEAKWGGYLRDVGGRAEDGSEVWGGGRDLEEMCGAMDRWLEEQARMKGIERGERGGFRLLV
ncbi:hypothetical protein [Synechococcus sp. LA31]|uniref:hypothetical protein n=1 Tax=Synechococcus sp. LA31 TaxID=2741953 RepID=UPI001BDD873B|nr:hypothetical protein [Synechococcus sp. LA31]QVV66773.1 hypothetical protein KJJ24_09780 [Synechococcus sp. LA31]